MNARSVLLVAFSVSAACGGARAEAPTAAVASPPIEAPIEDAPIEISRVIAEAPEATCPTPMTTCDATTPCTTTVVALEPHEDWCAEAAATEDIPRIETISSFVATGGLIWIRTDRGDFRWTGDAWTRGEDPRGSPQAVFGSEVWWMPRQLVLTECHEGQAQCRSGGRRKCAAPLPECAPAAELELVTHGPGGRPIRIPNPLPPGTYRGGGRPEIDMLIAIAGTSPDDVWVLSSTRLFHGAGGAWTMESLDDADPIVQLLSDPTGVYARTRTGRRLRAEGRAWVPLAAQDVPFLGARVDAPSHPYVTIEQAQATSDTAFWGIGHLRAFGDRYDAAPAVVRYEDGAYTTFVGAIHDGWWLRADPVEMDALRPEAFRVLVDDRRMAPGALPFVEVRWQEPTDLVRLASGGPLLVTSSLGIFGLDGSAWTREAQGAFDGIATHGDFTAAIGSASTLMVREPSGWCAALHTERRTIGTVAIAQERAWLADRTSLYGVRRDYRAEVLTLQVRGHALPIEQVLSVDDALVVVLVAGDGERIVATFDGAEWSATSLGSLMLGRLISNGSALLTEGARYEGGCWTPTPRTDVPLRRLSEAQTPVLSLIGDTEASLVMRVDARDDAH